MEEAKALKQEPVAEARAVDKVVPEARKEDALDDLVVAMATMMATVASASKASTRKPRTTFCNASAGRIPLSILLRRTVNKEDLVVDVVEANMVDLVIIKAAASAVLKATVVIQAASNSCYKLAIMTPPPRIK